MPPTIKTTSDAGTHAGSTGSGNWLRSMKNSVMKLSHKFKQLADEVLSSDELAAELFVVYSSSSSDSAGYSGRSSAADQDVTSNSNVNNNTNINGLIESNTNPTDVTDISLPSKPVVFGDFNSVEIANRLRKEDEPFVDGPLIWEKRRQAWLCSDTCGASTKPAKSRKSCTLHNISKESYPTVYKHLIEKEKTLKRPMNLQDAVEVINAGWLSSKK